MYKLIAIDLDDTLLNDRLEVTEGTKQAMQAAIDQGVVVTLATGRMFASAKKIAGQLGLDVPLITYHGSLVKNMIDETVLYERSIPTDIANVVHKYCTENQLHLQLFIDDIVYAQEENEKIIEYGRMTSMPYQIEADFSKLLLSKPTTKMIIIDEPLRLDEIAKELRGRFGEQIHISKSKPNYLEFMHPEGTKGDAIQFLAALFGCELSEVIAIGDSWNDCEMIEAAGLGVAMENAIPALKEIADYVTKSNNDEGVRHVIEKFVLQLE